MQAGGRIVVFFSKNPSKNPVANLSPVCRHCVARLATADEKKRQKSLCRQPVASVSPGWRQTCFLGKETKFSSFFCSRRPFLRSTPPFWPHFRRDFLACSS